MLISLLDKAETISHNVENIVKELSAQGFIEVQQLSD
jgi:hypothetical protein